MATTRQHLNEAALSVTKLLGIITGMTDAEIDEILSFYEVGNLAESARNLHEYTVNRKAHNEGRSRPLQDFIDELEDTSEPCPECEEGEDE